MTLKMKFKSFKRIVYILIAIALPLLSFADDNVQALFQKGNNYYAKAQYKEALKAYQQIVNDGYKSAAVYFNMGNASYKNDDIPSALLYYEKAHKLAPGDEDINFNIRFANLKTTDKIDEAPELFLNRWWREFILSVSVKVLAVLSILFVLAGSAMLIVYFFTNSVFIKKASFYTSIILFFFGMVTLFVSSQQVNYFESHKQAIIFSGSVNVKSGPVEKAGTLFVLHDGTKVNVLDSNNDWIKIKLANGNEGWIKSADVKEI
ncbi:MAG: Tetratricopeptide repeat protein [Mucilaginibacter sp.]|nr:Tetratricopeptide repeat protein [Mucilaginibacter sp.]